MGYSWDVKECSVEHCHSPKWAHGLCSAHLYRKKNGKPLDPPIATNMRNASLKDRLDAYADVRGPDECWLWQRFCDDFGYGHVYDPATKASRDAHVAAWELANGPVPEGMLVRHLCNVPACVNPRHLALGTQADNMRDKVEHSRQQKGEECYNSKLTAAQVIEIRERYAAGGIAQTALAREYGTSSQNICAIIHRKAWTHV